MANEYKNYFFAHLTFNMPDVYDYELIIYHSKYKQECEEIVQAALDALDIMHDQY